MYIMGSDILISESKRSLLICEIEKWSQCEITAFIVDNLKLVNTTSLKFVTSICLDLIEKSNVNKQFSAFLEEQANDISYFQVLNDKSIEKKLNSISSYLPLLKPNSPNKSQLMSAYFIMIRQICDFSMKNNIYLNECREICIIAFLHPIFDENQKVLFKNWANYFEKAILDQQEKKYELNNFSKKDTNNSTSYINNSIELDEQPFMSLKHEQYPSLIQDAKSNDFSTSNKSYESNDSNQTDSSDFAYANTNSKLSSVQSVNESLSSINSNLPSFSNTSLNKRSLKASASLPLKQETKPSIKEDMFHSFGSKNYMNNSTDSIFPCDLGLSNENIEQFGSQNIVNESSNNFDSLVNSNNPLRVRNFIIFQWLKNIRLHKYTDILSALTYNELLELTDDKLMNLNITLGARKRILTNVNKLNRRNEQLEELIRTFDSISNGYNGLVLKNILDELMQIAMTPMKPHNSPPTSLALVDDLTNRKDFRNEQNDRIKNKNDLLCANIIDLLERIQNYLINEKTSPSLPDTPEKSDEVNEAISLYLKIIDKLFLTKAFNDVQQTHMAKLRSSLHEKRPTVTQQTSRSKSPVHHHNNHSNFQNARQRIFRKNNKMDVERTTSAPSYHQSKAPSFIKYFKNN